MLSAIAGLTVSGLVIAEAPRNYCGRMTSQRLRWNQAQYGDTNYGQIA